MHALGHKSQVPFAMPIRFLALSYFVFNSISDKIEWPLFKHSSKHGMSHKSHAPPAVVDHFPEVTYFVYDSAYMWPTSREIACETGLAISLAAGACNNNCS